RPVYHRMRILWRLAVDFLDVSLLNIVGVGVFDIHYWSRRDERDSGPQARISQHRGSPPAAD
ncbi:hypothetical protein, partial [Clostridium perfringens]